MCGANIGSSAVGTSPSSSAGAINILNFSASEKGRRLVARFTDSAVGNLGSTIALMMGTSLKQVPWSASREATPVQQLRIGEASSIIGVDSDASPMNGADSHQPTVPALRMMFQLRDGRLTLVEPRLKARGKSDFVRRLVCLFLYAAEDYGLGDVSRGDVTEVLNDWGVNDGNSRQYVSTTTDFRNNNGAVRLIGPGREFVTSMLAELADDSIPNRWSPGAGGQRKSARPSKDSLDTGDEVAKDGRAKKSASTVPKAVREWVDAWSKLALPLDGHRVFGAQGNLEKGLVGLWAIRRATTDQAKAVTLRYLSLFLFEAFELKVHGLSVKRAFESDAAKGRVVRVPGTKYQIQPPGMDYIEELAGLTVKKK